MLSVLAVIADLAHVLCMLIWALGLPLLLIRRWPRARLVYTIYAVSFVVVSQLSHVLLGECFLTTLSRSFWESAGQHADGSFTARLVNFVAGIRPTQDAVVIAWEAGIALTSLAVLWSLRGAFGAIRARGAPSRILSPAWPLDSSLSCNAASRSAGCSRRPSSSPASTRSPRAASPTPSRTRRTATGATISGWTCRTSSSMASASKR